MGTKIEIETTGALFDVDHKTLQSASGGLLGKFKAEHYPNFRLFGSQLEFKLETTEQTFLNPKSLADLSGQVKVMALEKPNLTLTSKYYPGKKLIGGTAKLKNKIANRSCETELKASNGKPVGGEFEMRLDPRNKLQLETLGTKADSVKWTLERGLQQLKIKTVIPKKQLVLGLDSIVGIQKWDLEYNCNTGLFDAKVKVWPMKLNATTTANKDGVKPISWRITCERAWLV